MGDFHAILSLFVRDIPRLRPVFHGRGDGGQPEWPPSPLRLYQALVAAAVAKFWHGAQADLARDALSWLERQAPPKIVAPAGPAAVPVRLAVPNNDLDAVAAAWAKRQQPRKQQAELKTMKLVRPMRMTGGNAVHYLWDLAPVQFEEFERKYREVLFSIARSTVALGWGVDLVAGNARLLSPSEGTHLVGDWWWPTEALSATGLRTPVEGTLTNLSFKHEAFLNRLSPDGFEPVPQLTAFRVVSYRREFEPVPPPFTAFQLLQIDGNHMRPFNTTRHACSVAGMLRHATGEAAADWERERRSRIVFGHASPDRSAKLDGVASNEPHSIHSTTQRPDDIVGLRRFAYLPLPSLEFRGKGLVVGNIRRAVITSFCEDLREDVRWARRAVNGQDLVDVHSGTPQAMLSAIPGTDKMVQRYVRPATTWATVTPVIFPGHDDRNPEKGKRLLRKAIAQAGFSDALASHAELEFRSVGYWPGADLASRYFVPRHLLGFPRFHVRIIWKSPQGCPIKVPGPICFGGGRHYGLGLFAPIK